MKRTEYPRPQFVRREWQCLNGSWEFAFDDENRAQADHWELDSFRPEGRIEVPFCFESKLSGIGDTSIPVSYTHLARRIGEVKPKASPHTFSIRVFLIVLKK